MSLCTKRAIALAAAFVSTVTLASAQTTQPAAPEKSSVDQIKQPVDWFKWGADLRLRHEFIENGITLNGDANNTGPGDIWSFNRYRARVFGSILPADNISINGRLTWEGRYYWEPDAREGFDDDYIIADQFNVSVKDLAGTKSNLTVGRQDIVFLDGWLILDGTPLDGSRTIFFDAIRYQYEIPNSKFSLDIAGLKTHSEADDWSPIMMSDRAYPHNGSTEARLVEQDEEGVFVDLRYKPQKGTQFDGYYIYKHSFDPKAGNAEAGFVHAIGGRAEHGFSDKVVGRLEGVYEFGDMDNGFTPSQGDLSAYGATGRLTYLTKDSWDTKFHVTGEYLSGDNPDTSNNEAFTSMWGRWPQFSELFIYTYAAETRIADVTNLIRFGPSVDTAPTKQLSFNAAYYALFAAERTYNTAAFGDDYFRGHLLTAVMKYKFNRYMSGHLWGEYFIPGDYYSETRDDNAIFLRAELNFTF